MSQGVQQRKECAALLKLAYCAAFHTSVETRFAVPDARQRNGWKWRMSTVQGGRCITEDPARGDKTGHEVPMNGMR